VAVTKTVWVTVSSLVSVTVAVLAFPTAYVAAWLSVTTTVSLSSWRLVLERGDGLVAVVAPAGITTLVPRLT